MAMDMEKLQAMMQQQQEQKGPPLKTAGVTNQPVDLVDQINWASVECLNEVTNKPIANALRQGPREDPGLFLESDCDEELLITIPFIETLKLHSLIFKAVEGDIASAPKRIKILINIPSLSFDDAGSLPATDVIELSEQDLIDGKAYALKFVKFQKVNSVHLYVESNQGGEEVTRLGTLKIMGIPAEGTSDMSKLEKVG